MGNRGIGLDGRNRDENGRIRAKNGNTRLDTLRKVYGSDFGGDRHGNMLLENYLAAEGYDSLSQALRNSK